MFHREIDSRDPTHQRTIYAPPCRELEFLLTGEQGADNPVDSPIHDVYRIDRPM